MGNAAAQDLARNRAEYETFWSQRWRRYWTYSNQGKLRRFRGLMQPEGWLSRPNLRVCDVGFGLGSMLFAFPPTCDIAGLELSSSAVDAATAVARRRGHTAVDLRVFDPSRPFPIEWRDRFDVLIASHVLEHIDQPGPALDAWIQLLRPGGVACLVVPINEKPGDDLNHFHFFTEASFLDLIERSGLHLLRSLTADRILHLVRPLMRRIQRGPSRLDRIQSILFNAVFGLLPLPALNLLDFHLLPSHWPMAQCFALARKPGPSENRKGRSLGDIDVAAPSSEFQS